jgi:hypothetical protein
MEKRFVKWYHLLTVLKLTDATGWEKITKMYFLGICFFHKVERRSELSGIEIHGEEPPQK